MLDYAVESVFDAMTAWHCELDPAASKVLARRWPGVLNHGDLIATDWSTVEPVDIICAGWPCQPFSLAGRQKGAADERAIWPHIARAIRILRPRIVCLENVPAVLVSEFGRVADCLGAFGYDLRWTCLRASDVGAPHRRERLFVVATNTDRGRSTGHAQRNLEQAAGIAASFGDDADRRAVADGGNHGCVDNLDVERSLSGHDAELARQRGMAALGRPAMLPTPTSRDGKGHNQRRDETCLAGALLPTPRTTDAHGAGEHGQGGQGGQDLRTTITLLQTPSVSDALGGHLSGSGDRRDEALLPGQAREMATAWGKYAPAIARWEAVTRPAPAPTEPNKNGNPRLSAAFSEWLMGWPAGWVTDVPGISRNDALRIVGNGVVPQCAEAALRYLLSVACEVVA
jgi:DNA (cytosine-5)-methyltransferase 1